MYINSFQRFEKDSTSWEKKDTQLDKLYIISTSDTSFANMTIIDCLHDKYYKYKVMVSVDERSPISVVSGYNDNIYQYDGGSTVYRMIALYFSYIYTSPSSLPIVHDDVVWYKSSYIITKDVITEL